MSKKVLVIDDEEAVRKSFVLALESSDYKVATAESGKRGIEDVKNLNPDLVFLDLKMPEMNGVETLKEIRKIAHDVPVYIATAFAKEFMDELTSLSKSGIGFELVSKPLGADQILSITNSVLNGAKS